MRNKKLKIILTIVYSFIMKNLELVALSIALQVWFDAGNKWEYWVTMFVVALCSGISTAYNKDKTL